MRTAQIVGFDEPQVFALVRTEEGPTQEVGLGPRSRVQRMGLEEGDRIRARGERARVDQNQVLVAHELQGMARDKSRSGRDYGKEYGKSGMQQERASQGSGDQRLDGRIVKAVLKPIGRDGTDHVIALMELQDGRRVPLDLGRHEELQRMNVQLDKNKDVALVAQLVRIGNKTIYFAKRLQMDGRTLELPSQTQPTAPLSSGERPEEARGRVTDRVRETNPARPFHKG